MTARHFINQLHKICAIILSTQCEIPVLFPKLYRINLRQYTAVAGGRVIYCGVDRHWVRLGHGDGETIGGTLI